MLAGAIGLASAVLPPIVALLLVAVIGYGILCIEEPVLALIVMLVVAPLKTLIETEFPIALPLDIGQLSLLAAIGFWFIRQTQFKTQALSTMKHPLLIPIAIFTFMTLLTIPTAISVSTAISEWLKWLEIILLIVMVASHAYNNRWEWIIIGLLVAGLTQAIIGLYEFRGGSGAPHLWILDYQYFRAFGTFGQPNPFGTFMGLLLPLALGATWGAIVSWWNDRNAPDLARIAFYGFASLLLLIGLFISWSRGAWMGFGAASLTMLFFLPRKWWQGVLSVFGIGMIFAILLSLGLVPPQLMNRVTDFSEDFSGFQDVRGIEINDENYAVVERLAHWQSALDMTADYPLTGVGFGNYEAAYPQYQLVNWPDALGHAHNYYLNLLAETGILGLGAYVMMWSSIFWLTWRQIAHNTTFERGVALGLIGVWVHIAIHSLVDKLYVNNLFLHIGVLLGLLAVLMQLSQHSERTHR